MRWLIAIALAALLSNCGPSAPSPPGAYRHPARGFSLEFPAGWEVREGELGLDVIGLSPNEGPSDQFRDNVSVASAEMPSALEADAILDGQLPSMINVVTDFRPGARGRARLGEADAAWLEYTQRQGVFRLTVRLYALPGRGRAHLIYCTAETSAWERFRPRCEQAVNSFRVIR